MVLVSPLPEIKEPTCNLIQLLFDQNPNRIPNDRKVLIDISTEESLTYGQLKDKVLRFAAGLQDNFGFSHGDVLAIYAPNQFDSSVPLLGAVAAGGATSPANPAYTPNELAHQLRTTKAKILIAHTSNVENALIAADMVELPRSNVLIFGKETVDGIHPYSHFLSQRHAEPVNFSGNEAKDTVAYLCFSSGTTGKSKGVMTTHANITSNVLQFIAHDSSTEHAIRASQDKSICLLPFFHIFGLNLFLHCMLYLGVPVYVVSRFNFEQFCAVVQRERLTFCCLVPPIVLLLAKSPVVDQYDLSSLRLVLCGAAPLGADLSRQTKERFPGLIVKQGYGLTETSPVAIVEKSDRVIDGSIGVLVSNMTAKIVNEKGEGVSVGERGELWLKGPNIMKGYIDNPEATADCIDAEGYFHTGDVAQLDEKGNYYIVDRIKELIKYKGFQVPPAELEAILLSSPVITDCAVIGVYHPEQATEIPRAYIVLKSGVPANEETSKTIKKFVADQVVHYKQLRSIRFTDTIPKSPSGKILHRVLREIAAKEESQQKAQSELLEN